MAGKKKAAVNGMELINGHIEKGEFSRLYLMTGTEAYLIDQFRDNLVDALIDREDTMNLSIYRGDAVVADEIYRTATTLPFFADRRVVVVCGGGFFKKANDTIIELLENPPEETVLIISDMDVDKRGKAYKAVVKNGTVAEFDTPNEGQLLVWMRGLFKREGFTVEDEALYKLLKACGMNMVALASEVEKLKCYAMDSKNVTAADVELLSESQAENKIFEMTEALSNHDKDKVLRLYDDLLQLREPVMRILSNITRQYRILLKITFAENSGLPYGDIATFAGVPPYYLKNYKYIADRYTEKALIGCVERCLQADESIKTGKMKDQMAVEMLIMDLLKV